MESEVKEWMQPPRGDLYNHHGIRKIIYELLHGPS